MHIQLAYGKTGLQVEFPDRWNIQVVEPLFVPGLPDPADAIRKALRIPISMPSIKNVVGNGPVGIIFNDITRPTPNPLLLQAILAELPGVEQNKITLFVALNKTTKTIRNNRSQTGLLPVFRSTISRTQGPHRPISQSKQINGYE